MEKKPQTLSHKIIRNTAYNITGRVWMGLISIFLVPFIVRHIGIERFGVWSIVGVVTGYFGLLDFGISASYVKFIADRFVKKDSEAINKIISSGFIFYIGFTVTTVLVFLLLFRYVFLFLKIPPYIYEEAVWVFVLGVALFGLSNAFSAFAALQSAMQRMDISNKIAIFVSIPHALGVVLFLQHGYGLLGLMLNNIIIFLITAGINIFIAYRILPGMRFNPFAFEPAIFKQLFNFGFKVQIARIAGVVTSQTDKILIAYFLTLGLVSFYQLGSTIVYYTMSASTLLISALMPAFTELEARGERPKLLEAYQQATKYLVFFSAPLFLFLLPSAYSIMYVWMGPGYEASALIIQILAFAWVWNTIAQLAGSLCMAVNKPQLLSWASVIIVSLNIALSLTLVKVFGFYGVAWGTVLAVNIGTTYFLYEVHQQLQMSFLKMLKMAVPFFIASIAAALVTFALNKTLSSWMEASNRYQMLLVIVVKAALFSLVYLILVKAAKLLNENDALFLKEKFPLVYKVMIKLMPYFCPFKC